jgi:DNA-binding transcriptional LysR family regulator
MSIIDPELLRTFLAFAETGSLARAAAAVGRTASAVTAQMQRLEEAVGGPILAPSGRGRTLTPLGEDLAIHARRILDVNREAWLALRGSNADGRVAVGTTQDFADTTLPVLLRAFARTHPRVRLDLRIGRTGELAGNFEEGSIDILLAMRGAPLSEEVAVIREPMVWLVSGDGLAVSEPEVPVALLEPPCGFRSAAIAALETARRPFRIAASSGSLSGLCAAVRAGIAVMPRTPRSIGGGIVEANAAMQLPDLPPADFAIRVRREACPAAADLAGMIADGFSAGRAGA